MITFNIRQTVDEDDLDMALRKLIAAHLAMGVPIVITDTWSLNGQPIPHHLVTKTIWEYEKQNAHCHWGIDFLTSSDPVFDKMLDGLTQCVTLGPASELDDHPEYRDAKFSLAREVTPRKRKLYSDLRKALPSKAPFHAAPTGHSRNLDDYFDVIEGRWLICKNIGVQSVLSMMQFGLDE